MPRSLISSRHIGRGLGRQASGFDQSEDIRPLFGIGAPLGKGRDGGIQSRVGSDRESQAPRKPCLHGEVSHAIV